MCFRILLIKAQMGDTLAQENLLKMYIPYIRKQSFINGKLDEDLYQELCIKFLHCIQKFKIHEN